MRLLFSIDFDGVLTDHKHIDLSQVDRKVFWRPPRSVLYANLRKGIRQCAALLRCFGSLSILTARPAQHQLWIRQWLLMHAPELADLQILHSGDKPKADVCAAHCISMHIDDDFREQTTSESQFDSVLIWSNQPPSSLLAEVANRLNQLPNLPSVYAGFPVTTLQTLSATSNTPVFLVKTNNDAYKIRLFPDLDTQSRVVEFYKAASGCSSGSLLPKVFGEHPLAMQTKFIDGTMAEHLSSEDRVAMLPQLAQFFAHLHEVPVPIANKDRAAREDDFSYVSCAVDRFNVCRSHGGIVSLIDVGDCLVGSRWIDLIWAEQLFCTDDTQRKTLVDAYISLIASRPSDQDVVNALAEYYSWLHHLLDKGKNWNLDVLGAWRRGDYVTRIRRIAPSESALFAHAR